MRDAFILAPSNYSLQDFWAAVTKSGLAAENYGALVAVGEGDESVNISEVAEIEEFFEDEEELAAVANCGPNPRFYQLRFRDPEYTARMILMTFPRRQEFMLDNDHGLLVSLERFEAEYLRHKHWDWSVADGFPDSSA